MKILLTGGAGKLGRQIHRYLAGIGHQVLSYDIATGDDLLDLERLTSAARDCELTVHFGGSSHPGIGTLTSYMQVNVWGTIYAYQAARDADHQKFIFASSGAIYGWDLPEDSRPQRNALDEHTPLIQTLCEPYSASKLICENLLQAIAKKDMRMPVIALRLAPVWNTDQDTVGKFLFSALSPQVVCRVVENLIKISLTNEYIALNIADPWRNGGYSIDKARGLGVFEAC
jgi:nucleoside-diphosphate-sugar epimerase